MKFKVLLLAALVSSIGFGGVRAGDNQLQDEKQKLDSDLKKLYEKLAEINKCIQPNPNWHQKDDGNDNRTIDTCTYHQQAMRVHLHKIIDIREKRLKEISILEGEGQVNDFEQNFLTSLKWKPS